MMMPTLDGTNSEAKRTEIKAYFNHCYKRYELLFKLITKEDAYYQKAHLLRHPLIFYYGHTATFFINKFHLAKLINQRINPHIEAIFAVGVDEMSWDDLNEKNYNFPTLEETQHYRDSVSNLVNNLIDTLPLNLPITEESPWWVILMGIEHENIHLETSSVLIRQLPLKFLHSISKFTPCKSYNTTHFPQNELIEVLAKEVSLGKNSEAKLFGWDNEYGKNLASIPSFNASKYLVSNGEYLEFVKDNGYKNNKFWCEEGKAWKKYYNASIPFFWREKNEKYFLRLMSEEIPLPLNFPVEVTHLEASAFCVWKSEKLGMTIALPSENEYISLRDESGVLPYVKWKEHASCAANINLEGCASSVGVDMYKHGKWYDVIGNVWQWSATPIYPFDGFKVHPIYDDFTVPTYDGKHFLMNGGSWISCGNLATQKSRYAFRRHFMQHTGFRYVQSNYKENILMDYYTKDKIIAQYCHFGWGENALGIENYPAKCANIVLEIMKNSPKQSALDIGCAIGRSSFELAKEFEKVIGIDFSTRFIQEGQKLLDNGILRYAMPSEGALENFYEVTLKDFNLEEVVSNISFFQGDACNLKPSLKGFDLIFGGNLIDRLYDPQKFLEDISWRLNEKGIFVLTSPYTWQEESTPKNKWIGGYKRNGENISTLDGLKEILETEFVLLEVKDIPFVIQETQRKHQHTIAQMTIWEKR